MDDDSCSKFIGSLTKYLQSLCHSYVEFSNGVELVGHIYLHVDRGKKIDYVLNESVCKNGSNVVKFTSNSYHAAPIDKTDKSKDPPKRAPDPSKPGTGFEPSRKRDDNDVIIVGSEAAKRRRASAPSSQTALQPQPFSSQTGSGDGSGGPGAGGDVPPPSAAGMFRHPRGPNPRMAAPTFPPGQRPEPGAFPYQARKRMPPPPPSSQQQQPRGYLPMGVNSFNSRLRPHVYRPGSQPLEVRGTFPAVPSDVASIRGEYPPSSGQPGMGAKSGDPRYQSPFHPRPGVPPLSMHQGHHAPQGSAGLQGHAPHLLGSHLQNQMGSHLPGSMGPQGLMQPAMGPQTHHFLPPYPLSSHGPRQAPSMSLPVTTQLTTSASHPSTTTPPTTSASVAPITTTPASNATASVSESSSASSLSSAPGSATSTVMIKGRPVPIPASLASVGQNSRVPGQDSSPQTKPQASASSGGSSFHHNQSSGSSSSFSSCQAAPPPRGNDGVKPLASLAVTALSAGNSLVSTTAGSTGPGVSSSLMSGVSPKGRPSTPALEQCAAKKGLSPRVGSGPFQFPGAGSSSGSQSTVPGLRNSPPFGAHTSAGISPKDQAIASTPDHSPQKNPALSPRVSGSSGYFRYPGAERSQVGGSGASSPYTSLSINIPPLALPSSGSGSHFLSSGLSSKLHSPRAVGGGHSYNSLTGMDLSNPLGGGSSLHSPRTGDINNPYQDISGGGGISHLPSTSGGSSLHSPRAGERSHPYMGSSNVSHSSYNSNSQLSPRMVNPYMSSSSMSHQGSGSASGLLSPRIGNASLPYIGSSNISHSSSAGDSNLYSPRGYRNLPYMGSNNVSHVGDSNLISPRGGSEERSHPFMGSSNICHPDNNIRSPCGSDRGYPSYGDVGSMNLSHPPVSANNLVSPRGGDSSHMNVAGSDSSDRNQMFSSQTGNSLPFSSGSAGNSVSFSSLTHNDPFPSVSGSNFPFTSLSDNDLSFPPPSLTSVAGSDSSNSYPSVQNGRIPFPPHSGSSLPYPTYGDMSLPYSSVSATNLSVSVSNLSSVSDNNLPPLPPLSDMGSDTGLGSQLTQDRVRQTDNMYDMFGQPSHTDQLDPRFSHMQDTDPLGSSSKDPRHSGPSSSFPLNLSQQPPFSLDQGVGGDGDYSELVSELQALHQPPLNQDPTSPPASPGDARMPDPEGYPESDAEREQILNREPRISSYGGGEEHDPLHDQHGDASTDEEGRDEGHGATQLSTTCHTSVPPPGAGDVPQTFLAPYEISGPGGAAGGQGDAGGEEFRKCSGSLSSHSRETPSPSPGSVAGTETVVTEPKPQGQQASDYDSGCDSGSASTGERLASPQAAAQIQLSTLHPQLKSLTIPLVPVDSPNSTARLSLKQERPSGEEEGEMAAPVAPPLLPPPPPPEKSLAPPPAPPASVDWQKETDADWDMAALNHSDSTESYSEGDDPDYVPENPRSAKGTVKRLRNKKVERGRGKKRKVDNEDKGGEKEAMNSGKGASQATEKTLPEAAFQDNSSAHPEEKHDHYDPGMFLLLDTPSEPDRLGRMKASHTPAEVISTPDGETEGLWVHTLVPAGHGLWRLPPDDHKCRVQVDPASILRALYKVTVKIVAGKVLYKFDDIKEH